MVVVNRRLKVKKIVFYFTFKQRKIELFNFTLRQMNSQCKGVNYELTGKWERT